MRRPVSADRILSVRCPECARMCLKVSPGGRFPTRAVMLDGLALSMAGELSAALDGVDCYTIRLGRAVKRTAEAIAAEPSVRIGNIHRVHSCAWRARTVELATELWEPERFPDDPPY